ncbi:hypothetical protein C8R46DRAFT_264135 [Mycena filopes]|nr:hypothetical protein C8R46DRAFT_264135 [Mycena filopes]
MNSRCSRAVPVRLASDTYRPFNLVSGADYLQVVSYITAGSLTLLVYDTLLQINEEYRHVWRSRWTVIKCLYLWTRYSTFISIIMSFVNLTDHRLPSPHSVPACNKVTMFTTAFSGSIIGITELILMVRTYTLYERSRRLLAFFFLLWFSIAGVAIWAVSKWISAASFTASDASCWLSEPSGVGIGLVLLHRFSHNKSDLFKSLYCDGVWFYLAIWPFTIATVAFLFWAPPGLSSLPADGPVLVMHSVLACRLITHARAIAEKADRRAYAVDKHTRLLSDTVLNISPDNKV